MIIIVLQAIKVKLFNKKKKKVEFTILILIHKTKKMIEMLVFKILG